MAVTPVTVAWNQAACTWQAVVLLNRAALDRHVEQDSPGLALFCTLASSLATAGCKLSVPQPHIFAAPCRSPQAATQVSGRAFQLGLFVPVPVRAFELLQVFVILRMGLQPQLLLGV
jgi:hypothetical protein